MKELEKHRKNWEGKSDEWLFERLANELKDKVETIHKLIAENEQLKLCEVSGSLPTKEEISSELENHLNKWGKSHTEETNNTYALGFRHCFHFISDLYKVKR